MRLWNINGTCVKDLPFCLSSLVLVFTICDLWCWHLPTMATLGWSAVSRCGCRCRGSQIGAERVTEIFDAMRQLCDSEIRLQLHSQQRQQWKKWWVCELCMKSDVATAFSSKSRSLNQVSKTCVGKLPVGHFLFVAWAKESLPGNARPWPPCFYSFKVRKGHRFLR